VGSGGAVATGGTAGSAGTGTDRCDVGVYDGATQPKVLTLSGNLGTHDPSAAIEDSGTYYLYYTGLEAKTSTDLTAWKAAAAPFGTPAWMTATITGVSNLWAPDVSNFGGTYHMYYAGSTFGKNTSCIGHATRASLGSGSWTDQGSATICSNVNTTDNWNAIDPSAILDTDGTPWLVFGSFWSGIKIIQLDQTGVRSATNTTIYGIAQHSTGIEGPFLVRRCGYYYLFVSWDTCCKGVDSTYKIAVGRSTSINSGFVDKMGAAMTSGAGFLLAQGDGTTFAGPGGQSVTIAGTKAYLIYHAYAIPGGASQLRIADLIWDSSGWPIPVGP
jgi:arabinan endo-1,5-alpha-L-arabinosidase